MSGRVVNSPARPHRCAPGVTYKESVGEGLYALPKGTLLAQLPTPYDYPSGTVWQCECGLTWVSEGSPAINQPGVCAWRREGRFERWRRIRRAEGGQTT